MSNMRHQEKGTCEPVELQINWWLCNINWIMLYMRKISSFFSCIFSETSYVLCNFSNN
jgi:hypothetical protein